MPNKYPHKKGWSVPKQKYKISNWSEYNAALRRRGQIDIWMSDVTLRPLSDHNIIILEI